MCVFFCFANLVALHSLHEQIGDPHGVEEVPGPLLLLPSVLLQLQEVEHVKVPGLQVHGEGPGSLGVGKGEEDEMNPEEGARVPDVSQSTCVRPRAIRQG